MGNLGQSFASAGNNYASQVKDAPTNELDAVLTRFDLLLKEATLVVDRTHRVADRALGQRPPQGEAEDNPCSVGVAGALNDKLDALSVLITDHKAAIDRLDKFV